MISFRADGVKRSVSTLTIFYALDQKGYRIEEVCTLKVDKLN